MVAGQCIQISFRFITIGNEFRTSLQIETSKSPYCFNAVPPNSTPANSLNKSGSNKRLATLAIITLTDHQWYCGSGRYVSEKLKVWSSWQNIFQKVLSPKNVLNNLISSVISSDRKALTHAMFGKHFHRLRMLFSFWNSRMLSCNKVFAVLLAPRITEHWHWRRFG